MARGNHERIKRPVRSMQQRSATEEQEHINGDRQQQERERSVGVMMCRHDGVVRRQAPSLSSSSTSSSRLCLFVVVALLVVTKDAPLFLCLPAVQAASFWGSSVPGFWYNSPSSNAPQKRTTTGSSSMSLSHAADDSTSGRNDTSVSTNSNSHSNNVGMSLLLRNNNGMAAKATSSSTINGAVAVNGLVGERDSAAQALLQTLLDEAILISVHSTTCSSSSSAVRDELHTLILDMNAAMAGTAAAKVVKLHVAELLEEALVNYMKAVRNEGSSSETAIQGRQRMDELAARFQELAEREAKMDVHVDGVDTVATPTPQQHEDRLMLAESFRNRLDHVKEQMQWSSTSTEADTKTMSRSPNLLEEKENTEEDEDEDLDDSDSVIKTKVAPKIKGKTKAPALKAFQKVSKLAKKRSTYAAAAPTPGSTDGMKAAKKSSIFDKVKPIERPPPVSIAHVAAKLTSNNKLSSKSSMERDVDDVLAAEEEEADDDSSDLDAVASAIFGAANFVDEGEVEGGEEKELALATSVGRPSDDTGNSPQAIKRTPRLRTPTALFASATGHKAKSIIKKVYGRLKPAPSKDSSPPSFVDKVRSQRREGLEEDHYDYRDGRNENDSVSAKPNSSAIQKASADSRETNRFSFFARYNAMRPPAGRKVVMPYTAPQRDSNIYNPSSSSETKSYYVKSSTRFGASRSMVNAKTIEGTPKNVRFLATQKANSPPTQKTAAAPPKQKVTGPPTLQGLRRSLADKSGLQAPTKNSAAPAPTNKLAAPLPGRAKEPSKSSAGAGSDETESESKPWWKSSVAPVVNDTVPFSPPPIPTTQIKSSAPIKPESVIEAQLPSTLQERIPDKIDTATSSTKPQVAFGGMANNDTASNLKAAKTKASSVPLPQIESRNSPLVASTAKVEENVSTKPSSGVMSPNPEEDSDGPVSISPTQDTPAKASDATSLEVPLEEQGEETEKPIVKKFVIVNENDKFVSMRDKFMSANIFPEKSEAQTVSDRRVSPVPYGASPVDSSSPSANDSASTANTYSSSTTGPTIGKVSNRKVSPQPYSGPEGTGSSNAASPSGTTSSSSWSASTSTSASMGGASSSSAPASMGHNVSTRKVSPIPYTPPEDDGTPSVSVGVAGSVGEPSTAAPPPRQVPAGRNIATRKSAAPKVPAQRYYSPATDGSSYGGVGASSTPSSKPSKAKRTSRNVSTRRVSPAPYGSQEFEEPEDDTPLGAAHMYASSTAKVKVSAQPIYKKKGGSSHVSVGLDIGGETKGAVLSSSSSPGRPAGPVRVSKKRPSGLGLGQRSSGLGEDDDDGSPRVSMGGEFFGDTKMPDVPTMAAAAAATGPMNLGRSVSQRRVSPEPYRPPEEDTTPYVGIGGDGDEVICISGPPRDSDSDSAPSNSKSGDRSARKVSTDPYSGPKNQSAARSARRVSTEPYKGPMDQLEGGDSTAAGMTNEGATETPPPYKSSFFSDEDSRPGKVSSKRVSTAPWGSAPVYDSDGSSTASTSSEPVGRVVSTGRVSIEPYPVPAESSVDHTEPSSTPTSNDVPEPQVLSGPIIAGPAKSSVEQTESSSTPTSNDMPEPQVLSGPIIAGPAKSSVEQIESSSTLTSNDVPEPQVLSEPIIAGAAADEPPPPPPSPTSINMSEVQVLTESYPQPVESFIEKTEISSTPTSNDVSEAQISSANPIGANSAASEAIQDVTASRVSTEADPPSSQLQGNLFIMAAPTQSEPLQGVSNRQVIAEPHNVPPDAHSSTTASVSSESSVAEPRSGVQGLSDGLSSSATSTPYRSPAAENLAADVSSSQGLMDLYQHSSHLRHDLNDNSIPATSSTAAYPQTDYLAGSVSSHVSKELEQPPPPVQDGSDGAATLNVSNSMAGAGSQDFARETDQSAPKAQDYFGGNSAFPEPAGRQDEPTLGVNGYSNGYSSTSSSPVFTFLTEGTGTRLEVPPTPAAGGQPDMISSSTLSPTGGEEMSTPTNLVSPATPAQDYQYDYANAWRGGRDAGSPTTKAEPVAWIQPPVISTSAPESPPNVPSLDNTFAGDSEGTLYMERSSPSQSDPLAGTGYSAPETPVSGFSPILDPPAGTGYSAPETPVSDFSAILDYSRTGFSSPEFPVSDFSPILDDSSQSQSSVESSPDSGTRTEMSHDEYSSSWAAYMSNYLSNASREPSNGTSEPSSYTRGGFGTQSPFGKNPSTPASPSVPQAYLDAISRSSSSTKLQASATSRNDISCEVSRDISLSSSSSDYIQPKDLSQSFSSYIEGGFGTQNPFGVNLPEPDSATSSVPQAYLDAICRSTSSTRLQATATSKIDTVVASSTPSPTTSNVPQAYIDAIRRSTLGKEKRSEGWSELRWDRSKSSDVHP